MNIPIILQNKDFVIINKPAGLVVHADGRTKEYSVADWVLENFPEVKDVGEPITLASGEVIMRPGIVHRIDRDTSGILVIAKNQKAFMHLKELFQNREVHKTYHAFVYGTVKKDEDVIDRPIGRSKKDFRLWSAQRFAKGELREAVTEFKVMSRSSESSHNFKPGQEVTLVEAYPKTGRTHQIRVHFKAINHPVVCDKLYAPKRDSLLGFKRLALHAKKIEFSDMKGKLVQAEAEYPEDFEVAMRLMQ
jgi:23S rRNA pseudouridine1911/1915/1917 synthase